MNKSAFSRIRRALEIRRKSLRNAIALAKGEMGTGLIREMNFSKSFRIEIKH